MPLAHDYNAAQRREYYLRTRHLKGRAKAAPLTAAAKLKAARLRQAEKHKALETKINALQARLEHLKKVLAVLVDKAQARNGSSSTKNASTKSTSSTHETAKQKAAAKKASEKFARTHKAKASQTLSEQAKDLSDKVKTIEARIKKLRAKT